ncbi:hypothetical protein Pelo_17129 [Pelomyxa schiedti]|nr:hypothetical protein Pelo_17129 [Pelomyxa schiedti]
MSGGTEATRGYHDGDYDEEERCAYRFVGGVMAAARCMQLRGHPVDVASEMHGTGHIRLGISLASRRGPGGGGGGGRPRTLQLLAYSSSSKSKIKGVPCVLYRQTNATKNVLYCLRAYFTLFIKLKMTKFPPESMTPDEIADMLLRGAGIDPLNDAYKETPDSAKLLEMWWFDKVLTAISPAGCYIDPDFGTRLSLLGVSDLKEPIPTQSHTQHYADSHPNRLHPFLLGPPPASESLAQTLLQIDQAGSAANWPVLLDLVKSNPEALITRLHPESTTGFTPLHHAARGNAPADVITTLKSLGGDTNQRSVEGTPFEIARARGHSGILDLLHHKLSY